ncbi:acetyltransferase, GNAT family [Lachnospiraceae bacterium KM106-2]|nr:acetyltransferase, GNAT family [Lachnospiraceae bacterium KM106-2]
MNHLGTNLIRTKRLLLRPFTMEDVPYVYLNWASDTRVTRFLSWNAHQNITTTREVVKQWMRNYENPAFYHWAITFLDFPKEPVGNIAVVYQNEQTNMLHIGCCIGSNWWHDGIAAEAFLGIIPYLIEEVGCNRIEARHDPRNVNSGKVLRKCGLTYEGTLRESDYNNQGICDACIYALLAKDYESSRLM